MLTKPESQPKNVLLVEDDVSLNEAFGILLDLQGHSVKKAFNGMEALQALKDFKADIILLDLLMPVLSGKDFLKKFNNKSNIPIVVLSNLDAKDEIEEVLNLGATRYFLKSSITPPMLNEIIQKYGS
jgi:DNA-binding response OmpR family regulator